MVEGKLALSVHMLSGVEKIIGRGSPASFEDGMWGDGPIRGWGAIGKELTVSSLPTSMDGWNLQVQ